MPLLVAVFSLGCSAGFDDKAKNDDQVVARVDDEKLYFSELVGQFPHLADASDEVKSKYVQRWVEKRVLLSHIRKTNFDEKPDIRDELKRMEETFLLVKFNDHIAGNTTNIDADKISNFYAENMEQYRVEETGYKYEIVFFENENNANLSHAAFNQNNSLVPPSELASQVVRRESVNSFVRESQISKELLSVLSSLKIGEISRPFLLDNMHAIARLNDRKNKGDYLQIEDVREIIALELLGNKQQHVLAGVLDSLLVFHRIENLYNGAKE